MKRKLRTQCSYRAFRITWRFLSKPSSYENTLSNFYLFTIVSTSGGKTLQVPQQREGVMNKPRYVQCFRVALRGSYIGSTFCLFAQKEIFNHNILTALSPVRNSCVTVWSTMGIKIIVLFTMWHFSPCSRRSLTCSCNIYIFIYFLPESFSCGTVACHQSISIDIC